MNAIAQIAGNRPRAKRFQAEANARLRQETPPEQKVRAGIPRKPNRQRLSRCGEQQAQAFAKSGP
jgi:hypothetical protein